MGILAYLILTAIIAYGSPINYEMSLAGNFGEFRPNHFHGGVDVKTEGVEGKAIFSIGDGYVSKISVGLFGFGNAVYVKHPEGKTSVYCHLKSFTPILRAMLRRKQYQQKSSIGVFTFSPMELPVARGQLLAISGNTGASQAPHLHLELHDTKTWNMLDPLDYIGQYLKDGMAPMAHGFMAYPMEGAGSFNGGGAKQTFGFSSHQLTRKFFAWGKVGFGLWSNDYMESTYHRYGVRYVQLLVDGVSVYETNVSNIPVSKNLYVNYWGDYEHYLRSNVWYIRSYLLPGLSLPNIKTNANRGVVNFNQARNYQFIYVLRDYKGNESRYSFVVEGCPSPISRHVVSALAKKHMLWWNRTNLYQANGVRLYLGRHLLAENVMMRPLFFRGKYSLKCQYLPKVYPLLGYGQIAFHPTVPVNDPNKLYIVCNAGSKRYMGGTFKDGWVVGKIRNLGVSYELDYDDTAPSVTPVQQAAWSQSKLITIELNDEGSGIASYRGEIDGHFVLFEEVSKSSWVRCRLSETPIQPTGKLHQLKFIAVDNRGNLREYHTQIKY